MDLKLCKIYIDYLSKKLNYQIHLWLKMRGEKMLEKSSIQNLDNSDYRLKIFEEYKTLEKVNWKRVG